jgi:hypothetical protein
MYRTTGTGATATPTVQLATTPGAKLAITTNAQIQPAGTTGATGSALCSVSLDGTILDTQQVTVPPGVAPSAGGQTVTLVAAGTASSSTGGGLVLVQCNASNGATFLEVAVQAIRVDEITIS